MWKTIGIVLCNHPKIFREGRKDKWEGKMKRGRDRGKEEETKKETEEGWKEEERDGGKKEIKKSDLYTCYLFISHVCSLMKGRRLLIPQNPLSEFRVILTFFTLARVLIQDSKVLNRTGQNKYNLSIFNMNTLV